jgi:2-polyprenyl-3-methyl-5-hydroxy-6-metoxy-1,4-benzoquinol methylase
VRADLSAIAFRPGSVDLVTAFHVLNHVPDRLLSQVLHSIAGWLRDDGVLVASFPATAMDDSIEADWLGVPMFFAGLDADENLELVEQAGFHISRSEVVTSRGPDGELERFLWVIAHLVSRVRREPG